MWKKVSRDSSISSISSAPRRGSSITKLNYFISGEP